MSGGRLDGGENLFYGESASMAEVKREGLPRCSQALERKQMGSGKIADMNVIADAGAVGVA
jgi:hypothetical protein